MTLPVNSESKLTKSNNFLRNYIETYRQGHLVYVRNLKCASTFFTKSFRSAGWKQILFNEIDWNQDHVFGHIQDPLKRRCQGIVEYVKECGLDKELANDPRMINLLRWTAGLDSHSVAYLKYFGTQCWKIDWIPLISDAETNIAVTKKLLKSHSIVIADHLWSLDNHKNNEANQKSTDQLMQLMEYTIIDSIENLFVESIYFNQYIDNLIFRHHYNIVKDTLWPCCPKILDFHKLPLMIRKELATFHYNNRVQISEDLTTVKICRQMLSADKEKYYTVNEQRKHYSSSGILPLTLDPLIEDIELWESILQCFNFNGSNWSEISWVR